MTEYQKEFQVEYGSREESQSYIYHDPSGVTVMAVVRTEPKGFYQERYEDGAFRPGLRRDPKGKILTPLFPYRVQEIMKANFIIIVEGEKDVENVKWLLGPGEAATTNPMGAGKWKEEYNQYLEGKDVVIIRDKDEQGISHANKIVQSTADVVKSIKVIDVPGKVTKDVSDFININLRKIGVPVDESRHVTEIDTSPQVISDKDRAKLENLKVDLRFVLFGLMADVPDLSLTYFPKALKEYVRQFREFQRIELPERQVLMDPWLEDGSYGLICGKEGSGKTWLAMEIAAAVANGRNAMNGLWTVEEPVPVMFVDGEMHWDDLKQRNLVLDIQRCYLLSKMEFEMRGVEPTLNLADENIRNWLYHMILEWEIKLVIFDNIFSLVSGVDTNSDRDWSPINDWCLRLRAQGVSVILIHHTGKGGDQLGTSSRRFNINWSFTLIPPKTVSGDDPCSFSLRIDKKRGLMTKITGRRFTLGYGGGWEVEDGTFAEDEVSHQRSRKLERDCHIAKYLIDGKTYKEIAKLDGRSPGRITGVKNTLVNERVLKLRLDKGRNVFEKGDRLDDYFGIELVEEVFDDI